MSRHVCEHDIELIFKQAATRSCLQSSLSACAGTGRNTLYNAGNFPFTGTLAGARAYQSHEVCLTVGVLHVLSLSAGAAGACLGTAFLTTTEALTEPWQRNIQLSDSGPETTVTQAFAGKAAKGLATEIAVAAAELQEKLPSPFGGESCLDLSKNMNVE